MALLFGDFGFRGYEVIHQGAQHDELFDGNPWNGDERKGACLRSKHPIGNLIESAVLLLDQEVVDAIMLMAADNQHGLAGQRMKWKVITASNVRNAAL